MPASLPHLHFCPLSRPTFLHCPTIYWRNCPPPPPPQTERRKKGKASVTWHFIIFPSKHTSHGWVCRQQKAPLRQQVGDTLPHVSVTPERRGIMFTWYFLSVVLQTLAVTQATTHSTAEVQWVCSLASHPLDTRVTSHLSCLVCRTSSRSHCDLNPGRETAMKWEMCVWLHFVRCIFLRKLGGGWEEPRKIAASSWEAEKNNLKTLVVFIMVNKERLDKTSRLDLLQGHHSSDRPCMMGLTQGSKVTCFSLCEYLTSFLAS